ncbi:SDR family NAD(P)-dependent oxidoreductase [Thalassospira sp.]|uniref:SDR family NAD(P)-dependent oxidoreductase n=1 Tax=Thalassospira sp. TaxID=1912094 RepID=UPI003AA8EB19
MTFKTSQIKLIVILIETNFAEEFEMSDSSAAGTALITGASAGIGAIYADRLAKRGYDLVLVARNEDRLNAIAKSISEETGRYVHVLPADLSKKSGSAHVEHILKTDSSISVLVNNAGFGSVAPLLSADINRMEEMIGLNVTALTRLTYAAAPAFASRNEGTIINISSIVAIGPEILNGVYGATKAYVLALTQSLHHELADKGVRVQAVLPGATATEFWEISGMHHSNMPDEMVMRADVMVDAALSGLDQGEIVTIPPLQSGIDWDNFEASRKILSQKFAHSTPGARYREKALTPAI